MASALLRAKRSQTAEESVVRPVACHRCRKRRSYCSKDRPKCTRCSSGGFDCVYEEARRITVNEAYLRELESKVSQLESRCAQAVIPGNTTAKNPTEAARQLDEDGDPIALPEAFSDLNLDVSDNLTSFKGSAHSDHFLKSFRKASLQFDDGSLDCDAQFYDRSALPSRRMSNINHIRLPPISIARQLFAAQYTFIGTIFSFVSPEAFEALLLEVYQSSNQIVDQAASLRYAKLLLILAFGKMYSVNQWIGYDGPPGFDYFTHVLQLLPDLHEQSSVIFVETLALVGFFMQNLNRRDASSLYIGSALRMAINLGLHHEPRSADIDEDAREHRRRVWWSVYSLDRINSAKSGNPITIHDGDIGVELPSKLPNEPEFCPAVVLRHYTRLSQINGQIMTSIYRRKPRSGPSLMVAVQNILLALSQWQRDLPEELQFDPAKLSSSRESVSTLLYYSHCIHMAARPLLFHIVQSRLKAGLADKETDWRKSLTQTTANVVEMCIHAAKDTINMMMVAAQKNLVATYGFMDSDYAFSAAIVLVMVCVAFPTNEHNESMNAALQLLEGISHRGNSHLAARYRLLAHLRATFVPLAVPVTAGDSRPGPSNAGGFQMLSTSNLAHYTKDDMPEMVSDGARNSAHEWHSFRSGPVPSAPSGLTTYPLVLQPEAEPFDFALLSTQSLADGLLNDTNMAETDCDGSQEFWDEAFANLAGDSANTLVESLDWGHAALSQFDRNSY